MDNKAEYRQNRYFFNSLKAGMETTPEAFNMVLYRSIELRAIVEEKLKEYIVAYPLIANLTLKNTVNALAQQLGITKEHAMAKMAYDYAVEIVLNLDKVAQIKTS